MKASGRDDQGHKTPRWVKVSGILAVIVIAAFAVLHLAGGGFRHHHLPVNGTTQPKQP